MHQYWMIVSEQDYAEFDHELRTRGIFARAAHEIEPKLIVVYYEATQEEQDSLLIQWAERI